MTITLDTPAAELATSAIQELALDWLQAKEIEDAGKVAKRVRDVAAQTLEAILGHGGTVTVNKGGFKTYRLDVSERSRASEGQVLKALAILHPELVGTIDQLKVQNTNSFVVIALKPIKR